jgi:hypothetical protein
MDDALTDLDAYALLLEIQCQRLETRVNELANAGSSDAECLAQLRERAEMAEELTAFRAAVAAFGEEVRGADYRPSPP